MRFLCDSYPQSLTRACHNCCAHTIKITEIHMGVWDKSKANCNMAMVREILCCIGPSCNGTSLYPESVGIVLWSVMVQKKRLSTLICWYLVIFMCVMRVYTIMFIIIHITFQLDITISNQMDNHSDVYGLLNLQSSFVAIDLLKKFIIWSCL